MVRSELAPYAKQNSIDSNKVKVRECMAGRTVMIKVTAPGGDKPFSLLNIWAPHSGARRPLREGFWTRIAEIIAKTKRPLVITGDWNTVPKMKTRPNGTNPHTLLHGQMVQEKLSKLDLTTRCTRHSTGWDIVTRRQYWITLP